MLNRTLVHDGPLGSLTLNSTFFDGCTIRSIEHTVIFLIISTQLIDLKLAIGCHYQFWQSQGDNFSLPSIASILSPIWGENTNTPIHETIIAKKERFIK